MDSIFESSIFDPSSSEPSFLSFSSLADLQVYDFGASSPEPSHLIDWDAPKLEKQLSNDSGYRSDVTAESPSSSNGFVSEKYQGLSACLPIAGSARSSFSGSDDYPLLVTPTRQPSGPNPFSMESNRSSSSSYYADIYPPTPSLTNKSSCDSFASFSTAAGDYNLPSAGYQWDERSLGSSMGGYTPSMPEAGPSKQVAHRCVSNPALSSTASSSKHRAIVNRASMPALKEEETSLQSWSFEQANSYQPVLEPTTEDMLVEDLDWVFREKSGLGLGPDDVYPSGPAQPDWDTAATVQLEPAAEIYAPASPTQQFAWTTQQIPTPIEDPSTYIDPMSTFESNSYYQGRPMTAPGGGAGGDYGASAGPSTHGVNMGMVGGSGMNCPEMLSVPQASMMSRRSHSSEGYSLQRQNASSREMFAYTPQRVPTPGHASPMYGDFEPRQTIADRRQQLNVTIIPPSQLEPSTYSPLSPHLPPTPLSAGQPRAPARAIGMSRAGTQPLPSRRHVSMFSSSAPSSSSGPSIHLQRAQSIVQAREAQSPAERMASASVMQPAPEQPRFGGWEGPPQPHTEQVASQPVLTTAPLPRYHPMPGTNSSRWERPGQLKTNVTYYTPPDPAPSTSSAPTTPVTKRRVSGKPKTRTPSSAKRAAMKPGGFSWGEATFINFTSDDAEKILTGVAPSGSQSKRRRDEDDDDERTQSKRSRSRD